MFYKRILVAVDGSEASEAALTHAAELAKEQKSSLIIINVVNEYLDHELILYDISPKQYDKELIDEGRKILNKMKRIAEKTGVHPEKTSVLKIRSATDEVAEKIIEATKDYKADLLVVGSHGRQGITRFLLGSMAEGIIRIASTPVLVIHAQEGVIENK